MTTRVKTKVLVVGSGPGGYVAAIRCGQLGLDTIIVETDRLGGTCLIRGCIPSKALIHAADNFAAVAQSALDGGHLGIHVKGEVAINLGETVRWKDGIVDKLSGGVGALLKKSKVRVEKGWGEFVDAKTCNVTKSDGSVLTIEAENVILATGSEAIEIPSLPWSNEILSSAEVLALQKLPRSIAIVGAGYIGLELGMALRRMGAAVTVVEMQNRILPQYDEALTTPIRKSLDRQGIVVRLSTSALGYSKGKLELKAADGRLEKLAADKVLVTVGRRPRTEGWGLERMGVDMAGRFVRVDDECRTSMRNVWAIGDLVGEPMLAHKASAQGEMVAEVIAGKRRKFAPAAIPAVCFTQPEIVTVGTPSTDEETITSIFPLAANGRALTMEGGEDGGFIRVTARADDHRLLALAAVGEHVSELSGEMVSLIEMGASLEDVAGMIHAHPTQSEGLQEAALRALGHAIHI